MGRHQPATTMMTLGGLLVLFTVGVLGQEEAVLYEYEDYDFECPDEYLGYFPHLFSCDKYWACDEGVAELRTCGNGLAFIDTDEVRLSFVLTLILLGIGKFAFYFVN